MTNFEKLKNFVEDYASRCEYVNTHAEVHNLRAIAFGAVMFFQKLDEVPYEELEKFWNEAYDKFK